MDLHASSSRADELKEAAAAAPSVTISGRQVSDLGLLGNGAFSPLETFLGRADYLSVVDHGRLANGVLWPIPIVLPVRDEDAARIREGQTITLRDEREDMLAVLHVSEVFPRDRKGEALGVYGTEDRHHPGVDAIAREGGTLLTGRLEVLRAADRGEFPDLRLAPADLRARFAARGWDRVVAFQTRNPIHRAHEELCRRAAREVGGGLLLHPVVGGGKPGDIDRFTRVRCYRRLVESHFTPAEVELALLPYSMRMAGPREVVLHALVRRNHGATHMIVGRDHAGPGADRSGKPYYGPYEARDAFLAAEAELGIKAVPFAEFVYVPSRDAYLPQDEVPPGTETLTIAGTRLREDYLLAGKRLPAWFTREEVAAVLEDTHPPRARQGFVVWFTGLPSSGKSTIAEALVTRLLEHGRRVTLLDGDVVRKNLSRGLGFSKEDRDANILRIGFVANEVARHGGVAVCAAISPYREVRDEIRSADRNFVEVHVATPLAVCEVRDPKGLYARARKGEIKGFTGVDDPYESPLEPEVKLDASTDSPETCARYIVAFLESKGFLVPGV